MRIIGERKGKALFRFFAIAVLVAATSCLSITASAFRCAAPPYQSVIESAEVVFSAKVVGVLHVNNDGTRRSTAGPIDRQCGPRIAVLSIKEVWKGDLPDTGLSGGKVAGSTVRVYSNDPCNNNGFSFAENDSNFLALSISHLTDANPLAETADYDAAQCQDIVMPLSVADERGLIAYTAAKSRAGNNQFTVTCPSSEGVVLMSPEALPTPIDVADGWSAAAKIGESDVPIWQDMSVYTSEAGDVRLVCRARRSPVDFETSLVVPDASCTVDDPNSRFLCTRLQPDQ